MAGRGKTTDLIEGIEQAWDQRRTRAGGTQRIHQAEVVQVSDKPVGCGWREGEGVTPEVPLKRHDRQRAHACPDHAQGGFSAGQTGVEEAQARNHDQDHGRGHDDVGLVARLIPFVQVLRVYFQSAISGLFAHDLWLHVRELPPRSWLMARAKLEGAPVQLYEA